MDLMHVKKAGREKDAIQRNVALNVLKVNALMAVVNVQMDGLVLLVIFLLVLMNVLLMENVIKVFVFAIMAIKAAIVQ